MRALYNERKIQGSAVWRHAGSYRKEAAWEQGISVEGSLGEGKHEELLRSPEILERAFRQNAARMR